MSKKNLSISYLQGNIFLLKHIYNARIKNSSASQHAVSLNCTGANNQLMLKDCSKSDKITKMNYQQPHYLLYYCHLSENNEKKLISNGMKLEALLYENS